MFKHYTKMYGEVEVKLHTFLTWALPSPLMAQQTLLGQGLLISEPLRLHSKTHALGRTPLEEGSARRRGLYLRTHNTQETFMSLSGFETTIPTTGRRPTP